MGRKKKKPSKPWCWYCNREFDDEKRLIQHQKAKHFKCCICFKKLFTGPELAIHQMQVHKIEIDKVPNSLPSRSDINIKIYGMTYIPEEAIQYHERQKQGCQSTSCGVGQVVYSAEAASSPQSIPEAKRPCINSLSQSSNASSKIMHPDEDTSLEENRAQLAKYQIHPNMGVMPSMMSSKGMPIASGNPVLMNGMPMMRPAMGIPPGMSSAAMSRMGAPFTGQTVFPQNSSFPVMGQGGSRPF